MTIVSSDAFTHLVSVLEVEIPQHIQTQQFSHSSWDGLHSTDITNSILRRESSIVVQRVSENTPFLTVGVVGPFTPQTVVEKIPRTYTSSYPSAPVYSHHTTAAHIFPRRTLLCRDPFPATPESPIRQSL
jgi:hypothetical protein